MELVKIICNPITMEVPMCGRYYVDIDMEKEIEQIVKDVDRSLRTFRMGRDIHPTEAAPVITSGSAGLHAGTKLWGFPGFGKQKVIFNARSETALEKKMFRDSVLTRRCVIPASHFYEWNSSKEKFTFLRENSPVLYLAGFYRKYEDGDHFVILTTAANASMKGVHERMPLVLEKEHLTGWLADGHETDTLLHETPGPLQCLADYEQQSLWQGVQNPFS